MPQYTILRFEKHKGGSAKALQAHHEREKEKYASNPDIDSSRSNRNIHLIQPEKSYRQEVDGRIEAAGCRTRKDSTRFVDTMITASHEFFRGKSRQEVKAFFQCATDFLARKIGEDNIFTAVIHLDEKTPHMHLCFTPITQDGRLSAKDILGNRVQLSKWQDEFHAHMVKAYPDLERGESARETGRRHIPTWVFKRAVHLNKQATHIQAVIDSISPLNAGKKRDELNALLHKFFPSMEQFETVLKKYKQGFEVLQVENDRLKKEAGAGKSVAKQMEAAKLQSDYNNLRRFVDAIPPDLMQQIKFKQRRKSHTTTRD